MDHLKVAYELGVRTALAQFEKEAGTGAMLLRSAVPGAALGGLSGAIAGEEGSRGTSALAGAGLGALLGGAAFQGGTRLGIGQKGREAMRAVSAARNAGRELSNKQIMEMMGGAKPAANALMTSAGLGLGSLAAGGIGGGMLGAHLAKNDEPQQGAY